MKEYLIMTTNNSMLTDTLIQSATLLRDLGLDEKAHCLDASQERLGTNHIRVLLIGEYGRGKTAFLNALLGAKLLAESAVPMQTVNVIRWEETATARAGQAAHIDSVSLEAITSEEYERVELGYPLPLVRENIEIIEIPGLPDDLNASDLTSHIEHADLVVVALACDALYSASENRLVEQLKAVGHRDIFFVCNFFDRISSDEISHIQRAANTRIPANQDRIFFTSPTRALADESDAQAIITSFTETLHDIITTKRTTLKADRAGRLLGTAMAVARERLQELEAETSRISREAEQRVRNLNEAYEALAAAERHVLSDVDNFQKHTRDVIQSMTIGFVRDLALKIEPWLEEYSGTEPEAYLKDQIKQSIEIWYSTEFQHYLQDQVNRQRATLDANIERYRLRLRDIAAMLPDVPDDISTTVSLEIPTLRAFDVHSDTTIPVTSGKQEVSLLKMPEVILITTASVTAMTLLRPFFIGVPIGLAGIGVAAGLAARRFQGSQPDGWRDAARAYAADLRMKADTLASAVWQEVSTQLEQVREQIEAALRRQTEQVRTAVHAEIQRLQTHQQHSDESLADRLQALEARVEVLN
jgi:gas vesicle protein/predicted GTPase